MTQSTVEERFDNFIANDLLLNGGMNFPKLRLFFQSELQLAEHKAREDERHKIFKYLKANYIDYCIAQNGRQDCKNCGLDLSEMAYDLGLLDSSNSEQNVEVINHIFDAYE